MVGLWDPKKPVRMIKRPVTCPVALRSIEIRSRALEKIFVMTNEASSLLPGTSLEVYCFLIGSKKGYVEDILIPPQIVQPTAIEISGTGLIEVSDQVARLEDKAILGWAHSHGDMPVFSSQIDDINHETVLNDTFNIKVIDGYELKYIYSITVNLKREIFPLVITQYPCGGLITRKGVIDLIDEKSLSQKVKDKVSEEVRQKVSISQEFRQRQTQRSPAERKFMPSEMGSTNWDLGVLSSQPGRFDEITKLEELKSLLERFDPAIFENNFVQENVDKFLRQKFGKAKIDDETVQLLDEFGAFFKEEVIYRTKKGKKQGRKLGESLA
ncbi:MAG: hypothetical protein ACFFBD_12085 [Candidatus Hodarchaeota archaeon]